MMDDGIGQSSIVRPHGGDHHLHRTISPIADSAGE
jgi:hypothetical protein